MAREAAQSLAVWRFAPGMAGGVVGLDFAAIDDRLDAAPEDPVFFRQCLTAIERGALMARVEADDGAEEPGADDAAEEFGSL